MGISKSIVMPNGVTATYWKIVDVHIEIQTLVSTYTVSPFLDKSHADDRFRAVGPSKVYTFALIEADIFTDSITDIYHAILTKAGTSVPNLVGLGTHIFDPDLSGGTLI